MKFEYKFLKVTAGVDNEEVLQKLNDLGNGGWEVIATIGDAAGDGTIILKRNVK